MNGGTPLKWGTFSLGRVGRYIHIRTGKPKEFSNSKGLLHFEGVRVSLRKAIRGPGGIGIYQGERITGRYKLPYTLHACLEG